MISMFTHEYSLDIATLYQEGKLSKAAKTQAFDTLRKFVAKDIATYVVSSRAPKENFYPKLHILTLFVDLMQNISAHPFVWIPIPNPTPKKIKRLEAVSDAVYRNQGIVFQKWREVVIDYQMAGNDVIFKELMRDFGTFIAYFLEYIKRAQKDAKQHPNVGMWMQMLLGELDLKQDWFKLVYEDMLTLAAGMSSEYSKVPADVTELKTAFYDAMKDAKRQGYLGMK